ncbi:DUF192 domain-containing protein [Tsuneonella amylolytica]|uniref:DUF192 domain-containing protein n=1 Tax=Tsuneonella amylolytica TaxID=2338327 RepID=UPI000EA8A1BA|nr:DUF192 domain-containing protein [Tsuneonella amylolytica]
MRIAALVLMPAVLAACSPQPGAEATPAAAAAATTTASVHPESGLRVIPLSVTGTNGRHDFRVEVAASEAEQARGLMFRTKMGADEGMLFPRQPADIASFWMKNTPLPLDIIFIGTDRKVLNVADAKPYDLTPVTAAGLTSAVLELNAGRAKELGIGPGSTVEW